MKTLRIALGQLNSRDNIQENFASMELLLEEAADTGARLMVFPECSSYLSSQGAADTAEPLDGPIITRFRAMAKKYGLDIHNGSFIEKNPETGAIHNTSVYIDRQGEIQAVYRKIHLFELASDGKVSYRESATYTAGNETVFRQLPLGDFGFTICYDLRFPELFRTLTFAGARLIFVPSAFVMFTGKDHWEPLLRARAIENQVFIIAPGQFGSCPVNRVSYGNSLVVDPWGTVIARAGDRVGIVTADIHWSLQDEIRGRQPCLQHSRL